MIYFEYYSWLVDQGKVPATLCCKKRVKDGDNPFVGFSFYAAMAERIFEIKGNKVIDLKNRSGDFIKTYISDEDKIVLLLRAVVI